MASLKVLNEPLLLGYLMFPPLPARSQYAKLIGVKVRVGVGVGVGVQSGDQ